MIIGSVLIASGPFLIEFTTLNAVTATFYRMLIGGAILALFTFLKKEAFPQGKAIFFCFIAGLFLTLDLVVWNQSVRLIGSGLSTVLANLEVIFLGIIGHFFLKQRVSFLFVGICGLVMMGIVCLINPYLSSLTAHSILGILYSLAGSFFFSLYLLVLQKIRNQFSEFSSFSCLSYICLFGALILAVFMVGIQTQSFKIDSLQSFYFVLANSLLSQVFGGFLISRSINQLPIALSGVLLLTQPALTFLFDCVFIGRNTQILQLLGCFIILLAVYIAATKEREKIA